MAGCVACSRAFAYDGGASDGPRVPRLLRCGHSVCGACGGGGGGGGEYRCPKDNVVSLRGKGGLFLVNFALCELLEHTAAAAAAHAREHDDDRGRRLPTGKCATCKAKAAVHCRNCCADLCRSCSTLEHSSALMRRHVRVDVKDRPPICLTHGAALRYVCQRDKEMVCADCVLHGAHTDHDVRTLSDEVDMQLAEFTKSMAEIQQAAAELQRVLGPPPAILTSSPTFTTRGDLPAATLPQRVRLSALLVVEQALADLRRDDPLRALKKMASVPPVLAEARPLAAQTLLPPFLAGLAGLTLAPSAPPAPAASPPPSPSAPSPVTPDAAPTTPLPTAAGASAAAPSSSSSPLVAAPSTTASAPTAPPSAPTPAAPAAAPPAAAPASPALAQTPPPQPHRSPSSDSHFVCDPVTPVPADSKKASGCKDHAGQQGDLSGVLRPVTTALLLKRLVRELVQVNKYTAGRHDLLLEHFPYLTYGEAAAVLICADSAEMQSLGYWTFSRRLSDLETCAFPRGETMNLCEACLKAITLDPRNAYAYNGLAFSIPLRTDEVVTLPSGKVYDAVGLYKEAVMLNPDYCHPYYNLGYIQDGDVTIGGRTYTRKRLYLEALRCDANYLYAYYNLAFIMGPHEVVMLHDGRSLDCKQMYVEAIRCDADYPYSYNNLANLLGEAETVALYDGRVLTATQLYLEAIRCDSDYAYAYNNLANSMSSKTATITLRDGRVMTERMLYAEALRADPTYAFAYNNLALCMGPDDVERLADGRILTAVDLFMEALRHEHDFETALVNLQAALSEGQRVTLADGRVVTRTAVSAPQPAISAQPAHLADDAPF